MPKKGNFEPRNCIENLKNPIFFTKSAKKRLYLGYKNIKIKVMII